MPRVIPLPIFQHQADATIDIAPGTGVKNTVLDTTKNVRIIAIAVQVTWTVQPSPLEIHITIDGIALDYYKNNPTSATWYYAQILDDAADSGEYLTDTRPAPTRSFFLEGRSVKIEAETTGGTVSNLKTRVKYAKIP